jgi:hypothetical protein
MNRKSPNLPCRAAAQFNKSLEAMSLAPAVCFSGFCFMIVGLHFVPFSVGGAPCLSFFR